MKHLDYTSDALLHLWAHMRIEDRKRAKPIPRGRTTGQEGHERIPIAIVLIVLELDVLQRREALLILTHFRLRKYCGQWYRPGVEFQGPYIWELCGYVIHGHEPAQWLDVNNVLPRCVCNEIEEPSLQEIAGHMVEEQGNAQKPVDMSLRSRQTELAYITGVEYDAAI